MPLTKVGSRMELINRDLINKDIEINIGKKLPVIRYPELADYIDRAKTYLIKEKKCRPGQKILMSTNIWPEYVVWWTAAAELGMAFVVSDYPYIGNRNSVAEKLSLYGEIDHLISFKSDKHNTNWPRKIVEKIIEADIFYSYKDTSYGSIHKNKPSDVILFSTSSGTTGTPKIIKHTQEFFFRLLHRNANLYKLKKTDRCLHTKGLHHGSVTGVYFLPVLKYCRYHYWVKPPNLILGSDDSKLLDFANIIREEKINRSLLFYSMPDLMCKLDQETKLHDNCNLYVLAKLSKTAIDSLAGRLGCNIFSIFGCTETSGPLFLPEINPQNYLNYQTNNFGPVLDDFYHIELDSKKKLQVTMPDGSIVETGDCFWKKGNDYIFEGRENLYRINDKVFYLNILIAEVERILGLTNGEQIDIVPDSVFQQIYIRSDKDIDLYKLNKQLSKIVFDNNYRISKKVVGPKINFLNGIKFDPEAIRLKCRQDEKNLVKTVLDDLESTQRIPRWKRINTP